MNKFLSTSVTLFVLPIIFLLFILLIPIMRLEKISRKILGRKPRVIWGPTPIVNIEGNAKADRKQGYKSDTLVYSTYYISNKFTFNLEKYFRNPLFRVVLPYLVFLWASLRYDIFQFFYDGGFLYRRRGRRFEIPLLRLAGKGVVVSAYGADVRLERKTRKLGKYHAYTDYSHEEVSKMIVKTDEEIKNDTNHSLNFASICLSMGDMTEYTPGSKNDVYYWSIDLEEYPNVGVRNNKTIKIVHAPNHRKFKGTKYLEKAVSSLRKKGLPIELILVEKIPNIKAREIYKQADIIAEQFLIGWHGFFGVEAMALGKPVVCYIRKESYLPSWAKSPMIRSNPDDLEKNLEKLIKNYELRRDLGKQGRSYVEDVFSDEVVGKKMGEIYEKIW